MDDETQTFSFSKGAEAFGEFCNFVESNPELKYRIGGNAYSLERKGDEILARDFYTHPFAFDDAADCETLKCDGDGNVTLDKINVKRVVCMPRHALYGPYKEERYEQASSQRDGDRG